MFTRKKQEKNNFDLSTQINQFDLSHKSSSDISLVQVPVQSFQISSTQQPLFRKEKFAQAEQFTRIEKDILAAVLLEQQTYTLQEAQQQIQQFMNGEAQ